MSRAATQSKEFAAIISILNDARLIQDRQKCDELISSAIQRTEKLAEAVAGTPAKIGRKGGQKTAERGPEYFKRIAGMRKERKGGRPKQPTTA